MKWMTSGANRLKANLNRSFGARRNKKSALIKNYESIVVPPFERKNQHTRNKNRTKHHISANITNAAPPPAEVAVVDKEEDNTTTKRKIIRNGNPQRNRMIGVSSALPHSKGVSTFQKQQHNFGVDVTHDTPFNDMPFNNMIMSNQQHDNTTTSMTRQQQNDTLFNTDSIERFVNQQESQSAKKRQSQMQEIVIRERAIQREMKEVALMKQQHLNLDNNQQQQQPPMMMNGGGGLDFHTHNSYQNTQKSGFNFDLDMMNNNNNVGNGGSDILRNVESGGGNGLSRFRMQQSDTDDVDDEASTSQAIHQEEESNNGKHTQLEGKTIPMNDTQPAQLKPPPIRYFNNGVEVNIQGSPLSSITSQSDLLNRSVVGGGMHGAGHHVHRTQQQGMEQDMSKKQPPIQQPGMPNAMPQQLMLPQPQLMKPNTNHQMPNNLMTITGTAGEVLTTKEPLNVEMNQSTLPNPSAKLPHKEEDDIPSKAQHKAKKKAAKKEKRKRSTATQQSRSSKAQKIDKAKTEEPCHHQEVVKKDEPNTSDSNTKSVKKSANTNAADNQMPTKDELPSLTEKGCTSEQSLSAEKKSTNLKADQKMPSSTTKPQSNQASAASSSNVNANFIPKLSTHVSRGPHGDVLDQLFGGL